MAKTITHKNDTAYFGVEPHLEVAPSKGFVELTFELLTERAPTEAEKAIFELILNLSIDHGPETPSALQVIQAAEEGKSMSEAVAAGILQIGDKHGGAAEPGMKFLYKIHEDDLDEAGIKSLIEEYLAEQRIIGGFGHRIYQVDPRAELIITKLQQYDLGLDYIKLARAIEHELEAQKGRKLPLNVDGAIAVAFCTFGFKPELGKAVFMIARMPGLIGQYLNSSKLNFDKS